MKSSAYDVYDVSYRFEHVSKVGHDASRDFEGFSVNHVLMTKLVNGRSLTGFYTLGSFFTM